MKNLLFKNSGFRCLWSGQLISSLGDRLTQMGILTFLMVISGDTGEKMALVTFFSLLPFSIFGPLFGAVADRYSRKRIMIFSDLMRAALVSFIPLIWMNTHSIAVMAVWFFMLGSFSALFTPARMSIITNITDKSDLLDANSMIVTTGMVTTLVGTFIAGLLIKVTGVRPAFYFNALTFVLSAVFISRIQYARSAVPLEAAGGVYSKLNADIRAGLVYIRAHRRLRSLIVLSSIFSFISSFVYVLILNYGTAVLAQGSLGMGALLASAGAGMIAGTVLLLKRKAKVDYSRVLYGSYLIMGVSVFFFVFSPGFVVSLLLLFCAGMGAAILTITLDTVFQRMIPDGMKGKIFAARGLFTNTVFLLCLLLAGAAIQRFPATVLFSGAGIIALLTAARIFIHERAWGYQLLRAALRLVLRLLFNFKVSGIENIPRRTRYVFAGNHTSLIDGVALMCAYPGRIYFIAIDSLFRERFWGWCARRLGYIPVKRGGFNKEAIRHAVSVLKSGASIGIFPEGKITADGRLAEGKAGVALLARLADVDIIPFAIEGAYEAWPFSRKYPRRFPIEVRFGKPIDVSGYEVQEEAAEEVMKEIAQVKLYLERDGYLKVEPDEIIRHLINMG